MNKITTFFKQSLHIQVIINLSKMVENYKVERELKNERKYTHKNTKKPNSTKELVGFSAAENTGQIRSEQQKSMNKALKLRKQNQRSVVEEKKKSLEIELLGL